MLPPLWERRCIPYVLVKIKNAEREKRTKLTKNTILRKFNFSLILNVFVGQNIHRAQLRDPSLCSTVFQKSLMFFVEKAPRKIQFIKLLSNIKQFLHFLNVLVGMNIRKGSGTKQPILNGTKQPIFKIGQNSRF